MLDTKRLRPQLSLRILCLLVGICAIAAAYLPATIKQFQRHLVWSRYIAAKQDRDFVLERWSHTNSKADPTKYARLSIEYKRAQGEVDARLQQILGYCNVYNLTWDEMAKDQADFEDEKKTEQPL